MNQYGLITDPNRDLLFPVQTSDQHFRFMPGPEFSPRLYRGENEFHQICVPSMSRIGVTDIDRFFNIGKWIELSALMDHHPATQDLKESRIGNLTFELNIEAIAQHYGFKTMLMDFSRSKNTAMFFATCRYDYETEKYSPLLKGSAVIYTADLKALMKHRAGMNSFIPLGMEPLPRPEVQRALSVRMNPEENLNNMPWISTERIKITKEISEHYFEMFNKGLDLFPENSFDDQIRTIRKSKTLPLEALAFGMDNQLIPRHKYGIEGARTEMISAGYRVELKPFFVCPDSINAAKAEWESHKENYYNRISIRAVSDMAKNE